MSDPEINVCVGGCGKTGPVPPGHPALTNYWCPECKEKVMRDKTDRYRTYIPCDHCGAGCLPREIANAGSLDDPLWLCAECFRAWILPAQLGDIEQALAAVDRADVVPAGVAIDELPGYAQQLGGFAHGVESGCVRHWRPPSVGRGGL